MGDRPTKLRAPPPPDDDDTPPADPTLGSENPDALSPEPPPLTAPTGVVIDGVEARGDAAYVGGAAAPRESPDCSNGATGEIRPAKGEARPCCCVTCCGWWCIICSDCCCCCALYADVGRGDQGSTYADCPIAGSRPCCRCVFAAAVGLAIASTRRAWATATAAARDSDRGVSAALAKA